MVCTLFCFLFCVSRAVSGYHNAWTSSLCPQFRIAPLCKLYSHTGALLVVVMRKCTAVQNVNIWFIRSSSVGILLEEKTNLGDEAVDGLRRSVQTGIAQSGHLKKISYWNMEIDLLNAQNLKLALSSLFWRRPLLGLLWLTPLSALPVFLVFAPSTWVSGLP